MVDGRSPRSCTSSGGFHRSKTDLSGSAAFGRRGRQRDARGGVISKMPSLFTTPLAAPVASFSGPRIDTASDSLPILTRSMIAGIMGAALGVGYGQPNVLQKLQDTIRLAVVVHREGTITRDYQTVRMDLAHMT